MNKKSSIRRAAELLQVMAEIEQRMRVLWWDTNQRCTVCGRVLATDGLSLWCKAEHKTPIVEARKEDAE